MNINPETSQTELDFSEPKIEILKSNVDLQNEQHASCVMDIEYGDQKFKKVVVILNKQGLQISSPEKYPEEIHKKILELAENKIKTQKVLPKGFDPEKKPPKNWQDDY